ncbi:MAG: tetratricopeptide repeat protein [Phycisphaerae bacterium]|nr:tetratricopeptide repeat protein [Phycisphaerae bacterium]
MKRSIHISTVVLLLFGGMVFFSGCGEKRTISISYTRPAVQKIPADVRKIAIVQFGAKIGTEKKWGEIAADELASKMNALNAEFHRYILFDRKRLGVLMDERDFQMSITGTDEAIKLGKIAKVDAMIYGTVTVTHKDSLKTYQKFDPIGRTMVSATRLWRTASVSVNFTMDDIHTTRTLSSRNITHAFDSEKDRGGFSMFGGSGGKIKSTAVICNELINRCVMEFVARISPHFVTFRVHLEKGKTKAVKNGNKYAYAGEFADAIMMYRKGLNERPDDYGAMFNMGVCYEAQANLKEALEYYNQALQYKTEDKFIVARRRVRLEDQK